MGLLAIPNLPRQTNAGGCQEVIDMITSLVDAYEGPLKDQISLPAGEAGGWRGVFFRRACGDLRGSPRALLWPETV